MFYLCFLRGLPMFDIPSQPDPDQCVLGEDGQLKDAKDIAFFHSPSDNNPIPLPPVDGEAGASTDNGGMAHTYRLSFNY